MPAAGSRPKPKRQASTAKATARKSNANTKPKRTETTEPSSDDDDDDWATSRKTKSKTKCKPKRVGLAESDDEDDDGKNISATLRQARALRDLWEEIYLTRDTELDNIDSRIAISDTGYGALCERIKISEAARRRSGVKKEKEEAGQHDPEPRKKILPSAADAQLKKVMDPELVEEIVEEGRKKVKWLMESVGGPSEKRGAAAEAERVRGLVGRVEVEFE